jgi:hypothetical protein
MVRMAILVSEGVDITMWRSRGWRCSQLSFGGVLRKSKVVSLDLELKAEVGASEVK